MNRLLRSTLTCVAALAAVVTIAGPADAHEGEGILAVESTNPGDGGLTYTVRLTWANDGHPAIDSTVTATAVGPDGSAQTPVTLQPVDEDGRYRATVPLAGDGLWTVRFTSVSPAGTLEVTDQRPPTSTTTASPTTDDVVTTTTATTAPESEDGAEGESAAADDDSGTSAGVPIAIAFVVIVLVVAGLVVRFVRSNRRHEEGTA